MEKMIPEAEMTLYGIGVDSPVFLDQKEYENFPEDGIVGPVGGRYYFNYDAIEKIEYLREFDGKNDVFKKTSKEGDTVFYCLHVESTFPHVLEGRIDGECVSWHESNIDSLWHTYKGFRERGVDFTYDYYRIQDEINRAREARILASEPKLLQLHFLKNLFKSNKK